ncbi:MAG: PocR ligand-binding domain-containing protein [Streptococcaceae bacterium]|jgi:AraC-like DNA-binding protein/ligand-binding sensor protein|nr:PocR ligand-binding domain-containing protein [Streptococcaceae bacterium]
MRHVLNQEEITKKVESTLTDFSAATGLGSLFTTLSGDELSHNINFPPFCQLMRESPIFHERCQRCDTFSEIRNNKDPFSLSIYRCHAGLIDISLPFIHEGKLSGYILSGNIDVPTTNSILFSSRETLLEGPSWQDFPELVHQRKKIAKISPYELYAKASVLRVLDMSYLSSFKPSFDSTLISIGADFHLPSVECRVQNVIKTYVIRKDITLLEFVKTELHGIALNSMIISMDNLKQSSIENGFIKFKINGKISLIGAKDIKLHDGDSLSFYNETPAQLTDDLLRNTHSKDIKKILEYLSQNLTTPVSLESISQKFYFSPSYLSKLFKKETGITFVSYLKILKIDSARNLLLETKLSIRQISHRLGFKESSYFIKLFREMYQMTPTEYRKLKQYD